MRQAILTVLFAGFAFGETACANNNDYYDAWEMEITVNGHTLTATMASNSSAAALKELLSKGNIVIDLNDYGNFEKVGEIGTTLPRNDEPITTQPGDLILYLGNRLCIYYSTNTWNFTKLGHINGVKRNELKSILGESNVRATLALAKSSVIENNKSVQSIKEQRIYSSDGMQLFCNSGIGLTESLPNGIYFVKTTYENGTTTIKKIIK